MPYKSKEEQNEYQRKWIATRRKQWFDNKCCKNCGSNKNLELDHIDPSLKISHKIWSWSEERRNKELSKCQILCIVCHRKKTAIDNNYYKHNASGYRRGCRCKICTKDNVKKVNEWRWKTGRRNKRSGVA